MRDRAFPPPSWFENSVVYHVFLDRFSRGNASEPLPDDCNEPEFCGGNLRGVLERLEYLEDLGVDTILLSPFNATAAYHGYHVKDYYSVDPRFGSLQSLRELIGSSHARGMRILMDFVPNHVHETHPFFLEAQGDPHSDKRSWFYFRHWPDDYLSFLDVTELPKLDLDHPPARRYIIEAALFWLGQGIDGLRLDHVIGPSHGFWRAFSAAVKKDFPRAVLIGEATFAGLRFRHLKTIRIPHKFFLYLSAILSRSADPVMRKYIGVLDGVLDFELHRLLKDYVAKDGRNRSGQGLERRIRSHYARYPQDYCLPSFLDSHDVNRFLFEAQQDKEKLKRAAAIQFAQRQPAVIYYGTEVGLSQDRALSPRIAHSDLEARRPMPWANQDEHLLAYFKSLIAQRKAREPCLS